MRGKIESCFFHHCLASKLIIDTDYKTQASMRENETKTQGG